jgi:tetratricopeptide (TPR) repeat protein
MSGEGVEAGRAAMDAGRADQAIRILELFTQGQPGDARAWQLLGFAYRGEQRMSEAARAFARAAALDPGDALSALGHAQSSFEAGFPAAELFRRALALAPHHPGALASAAAALAAEGQQSAAEQLLADALVSRPDWLEGHRSLAALRWTAGEARDFALSYEQACRLQPQHLALRLAWFRAIAQTRNWEAALRIIDEGEQRCGTLPAFTIARLFVASESGDRARAAALFEQTVDIRDEVRDIAHIRHCLRGGDLETAEQLAQRFIGTPSAPQIWSYLSLIWRLRGDRRAQWLDGAPPYVRALDLDCSAAELEVLAAQLRTLHTARAPFLEQSVRGGTQTDRQLLFHHEPVIQALRGKIVAAVRRYVADLPGTVPGHPLLGTPRGQVLFSGSWSVRLQPRGYHVSHTHPMGWISSALYVALPGPEQMGAPPAGWIRFGTPPPELGLDLPPYAEVQPKAGQLVLFPSTMWHATEPFDDGERLAIAFDVSIPAY